MWFDWSNNYLASNLLFKSIRKVNMVDFMQSVLQPIKTLHGNIFPTFYNRIIDRAKQNSQILVLEQVLNEEFGFSFSTDTQNDIYISDPLSVPDTTFFYNRDEFSGNNPVYMRNRDEGSGSYMTNYNRQEFESNVEFDVNVPTGILNTENKNLIKSIVDRNKIAGKRFRIVGY